MGDCIQILTATDSEERAREIARGLVEAGLAACVQVIGPVASVYRWEGKIEDAREWLCLAKTRQALYAQVEAFIRERHSYDVPEIIAVPVSSGSERYLAWVEEATGG